MRVKVSALLAFILFASVHTAFAESRWINTSGGTLDWTNSGNWSGAFPPGFGDDVRITNDLSTATTIINAGRSNALINTATINFLAISNGLGSTPLTVIQSPTLNWVSRFGLQLGKNATLILTTNAQFGVDQNSTFDLRVGGQPGTLILSNAAATSGFSTFLVKQAVGAGTNPVINNGTIMFKPNNGQQVSMNYGQTLAFTNGTLGTIVMNGVGTGTFVGNFGVQNRAFINNGSIFAQAGTLRIDSRDTFSRGGFQNTATGYVQVDSGGVFELRRTTNAWVNGSTVTNLGTVFMNGGTTVAVDLDQSGNAIGTNVSRVIANVGSINGNGTFKASINSLSGSTVSPGTSIGTLNVGGNVTLGSNSTFVVELGLLAGQNDLLAVDSNLTLNANSILALSGGAVGNVYTVATAFAVSGTFGTVTPNYIVSYDPTDITVQFIPEPSTLLLVIAGLAGMVVLRRRG